LVFVFAPIGVGVVGAGIRRLVFLVPPFRVVDAGERVIVVDTITLYVGVFLLSTTIAIAARLVCGFVICTWEEMAVLRAPIVILVIAAIIRPVKLVVGIVPPYRVVDAFLV